MSRRELEAEIVVLRHQLAVLQRQSVKPRFTVEDRVVLVGLLHGLPRQTLQRMQLLVRPDTILRWDRDLLERRLRITRQVAREAVDAIQATLAAAEQSDHPEWQPDWVRPHGDHPSRLRDRPNTLFSTPTAGSSEVPRGFRTTWPGVERRLGVDRIRAGRVTAGPGS